MKRKYSALIVLAIVMAASFVFPAYVRAQDIDLEVENPAEIEAAGKAAVAVGLGAGVAPEYEGSSDYRAVPIPFMSVRFSNNMSIEWIANLARANLLPSRTWMAGPVLQYIQERDDVDNNKVDKLKTVDASLMAGALPVFESIGSASTWRPCRTSPTATTGRS